MVFGETAVAGVDQEPHVGMVVEEVVDVFGTHSGLVVLAAGTDGAGPQRSAVGVGGDGDSFGGGVGQDVGEGVQTLPGGGVEAPVGQQRPDLADRIGHGGAVHTVEQAESLVRQG